MQSHRDDDANPMGKTLDALAQLQARAEKMMERGESRITAGAPGEPLLRQWKYGDVTVRQLPDDDLALRISIGEAHGFRDAAYCVYRGDKTQVLRLLERAMNALEHEPMGDPGKGEGHESKRNGV